MRQLSEKSIHRLIALAVFVTALSVYLRTLSATVVFWDVGEFCAAARLLQVPHPPGSPLFILLARVASIIPFREDIAARMHTVSAVASAAGIVFLYLSGTILLRSVYGRDRIVVNGSAAVGALSLAFMTTYWDNSIEAEVYGMAMLFVAACLWLALRWREEADEPGSDRYLLLIAYLLGLAMGVHILALLIIIPILMIIYFRLYEVTPKSFLLFAAVAAGSFFVVYPGIAQILPGMLAGELGGGRFDAVRVLPPILVGAGLFAAARSYLNRRRVPFMVLSALLLILLGFTTYTQVLIRANVPDLPIKENSPGDFAGLTRYLTREQYGETPILTGVTYDNSTGRFEKALFPRRWSSDQMHAPTRENYSGDLDFLWRYQTEHMFIRYMLWNLAGVGGTGDDAGVSWSDTWGIPLVLACAGCISAFRRDRKTGFVLLTIFLIMGIVLDLYQNQQDPQPRERDYFYVGACFICALWISFGIASVLRRVPGVLPAGSLQRLLRPVLLVVFLAAVPLNLLRANWRSHDRSAMYVAWDTSYNLLQSVERDAILFTNGDNDTFPLWYLQDVEGIRTDVRVICLSMVNVPWYNHQLKHERPHGAAPLRMSLSDADIDRLGNTRWEPQTMSLKVPPETMRMMGVTDSLVRASGQIVWELKGLPYSGGGRYLRVQDIMVGDIITANAWERPVYFAVSCPPSARIGLDGYLWMEGAAIRLRPQRTGGSTALDIAAMERNYMTPPQAPSAGPRPGFIFHDVMAGAASFDENEQRILMNYRLGFMRIADYFLHEGDNRGEARRVLERMEETIPVEAVPAQLWTYSNVVAKRFYEVGDMDQFRKYAGIVEEHCLTLLKSGPVFAAEPSSNPAAVLADLYGMRGDYRKAVDMLRALDSQYPRTPWIEERIGRYSALLHGSAPRDSGERH
ncbi:MAG TPA: DUF2723 domain-containing protein [Bacteroidota bacterium]|nr:DUF2723 domain-containing protein [Bacteroidota bacterium]